MRASRKMAIYQSGKKTIELSSISMYGGWRSNWGTESWENVRPYEGTGTVCRAGATDSSHYYFTNILFDQSKLATLRNRNIASITLEITGVAGYFPSSGTDRLAIGYKYNADTGIDADVSTNAWARSNADSTALATTDVAYVKNTAERIEAAGVTLSIDMGTTVPVYGYTIGNSNDSFYQDCTIANTCKLIVELA